MSRPRSDTPDCRVFEWLGTDTNGTPYHLHPLNLMWSDAGVEHDLDVYRKAAERLSLDAGYWSAIIRDDNWRNTLVGCVCLLVSGNRTKFDDLRFRLEAGSMVNPQIAVTMGLLHPNESLPFFEMVLQTTPLGTAPLRRVSLERVLACMGLREPSQVSLSGWNIVDQDFALLADRVVQEHWQFWRPRV